ncbi:MAG: hypothetical protein ABI601_04630 [bacterium]
MTTTSALAPVVGTELRLRFRDASFPLLIAVVLSAAALLVPAPTASYATITVDGRRLLMSADASLTAAGVVLSILLLPLFALSFDVGHVRDGEHGLDRLHLTTPVRAGAIAAGRLGANLVAVLTVTVLSLLVISSTIYARSLGVPSTSAVSIFLLLVAPVAIAAVALGALLDRYVGLRTGLRTFVAFAVWFAAMLASALGGRDLFGVSYLRQVIVPGGRPGSLAVGAISARGLASMPWTDTPLTPDLVWSRTLLAAMLTMLLVLLSITIRFRLGIAERSAAGLDASLVADRAPVKARHVRTSVVTSGRATLPLTIYVVVSRWLVRSRLSVALILITLSLAARSGAASSAAFAAALAIPAVIVSKTSRREAQVAAALESTTSALRRPTSTLSYCWMLALVALLPALPALVRTNAMQASTAVIGLLAATMWLTWAHRCALRPVLGTSTFAALWYLSVFNHPPASADVFGLWGANPQALVASALMAACAFALIVRYDRG